MPAPASARMRASIGPAPSSLTAWAAGLLEEPPGGAQGVLVAHLVRHERQVGDHERAPAGARDGGGQHQHLVHRGRHGRAVAEHGHRARVAHEHEVHAGALRDAPGRIVVGGHHHERAAVALGLGDLVQGQLAGGFRAVRRGRHASSRERLSIRRVVPARGHEQDRGTVGVVGAEVVAAPQLEVLGIHARVRRAGGVAAARRRARRRRRARGRRAAPANSVVALAALAGREVAVARREREAVGGAHGRHAGDLDAERQVARHAAHDHELLVVLLAEERALRPHEAEEARDHGGDAAEVAGACTALELAGQRAGIDRRGEALRVDRLDARREHDVGALLAGDGDSASSSRG